MPNLFAAGVAVLSKHKALTVDKTLPGHPDPAYVKGRCVLSDPIVALLNLI
jgi:hypothetical protein